MVFVQFLITSATNNTYFNAALYGIHDINIISLQFHDTGAATQWRVLELQSDILRFPHSSRQYLTFLNNGQNYINYEASGEFMPSVKNMDCNGKFLLNLNQVDGPAPLNANWSLVLTLEATLSLHSK
jgi:hypothetical protein